MEYQKNTTTYEDYIHLRENVNWKNQPDQWTKAALPQSLYTITAYQDGETVGMRKVIHT